MKPDMEETLITKLPLYKPTKANMPTIDKIDTFYTDTPEWLDVTSDDLPETACLYIFNKWDVQVFKETGRHSADIYENL